MAIAPDCRSGTRCGEHRRFDSYSAHQNNMTIKEAPPRLIIRGIVPGKKLKVLRKRGNLFHIRCENIEIVVSKELFEKIIVQ